MATAIGYGQAPKSFLNKEVDWDSDAVKVLLLDDTYAPNRNTHRYLSDITGEITGTNYTAGGVTLSGKSVSYDAAYAATILTAANPVWSTLTATFRYAVFYVSTGSPSTSPLLCYVDYEENRSIVAQNLTLVLPSAGLIQITVI